VTVGRQEGEPNITVIYDGEIIGGMTSEKRLRKKFRQSPGRVQAALVTTVTRTQCLLTCWRHGEIGGFVQVVRPRLPRRLTSRTSRAGRDAVTSLVVRTGVTYPEHRRACAVLSSGSNRLVGKHPQICGTQ